MSPVDAAPGAEPQRGADELARRYERELAQRGWQPDAAQRAAIARLERLRDELRRARTQTNWLVRRCARLLRRSQQAGPRGLYLWGGVGRGKTWLMDLFYDSLGRGGRRRLHFHPFMASVHAALASIRQREDPLTVVAQRMARQARVWCLDELHVEDIADAMLLGGLFDALLRHGVTLVITANSPPAQLYREGLQRARFLPAIALLESRLDVLEVDGGVDYRLRTLRQAPIYVPSTDPRATGRLEALFARLAGEHAQADRHILIHGRALRAERRAGGVVWFSFATLCESARSAADYAALAADFHTVFLAQVPRLDAASDDAARRFIALIDQFYDRGVKLVVSAAAPPAQLYGGARLAFEFRRTSSRLIEMQTEQYLAREHLSPPQG